MPMKTTRLKIFASIGLLAITVLFSACDPEPEPTDFIVGLNWRNDFEGKSAPQIRISCECQSLG